MSSKPFNFYLTKNNILLSEQKNTNVFAYNENGPKLTAEWIKKNVEQNDCNYVALDHNSIILREIEPLLSKKSYYIENITFDKKSPISINPFDFVNSMSEIHFMFLNFLHIFWDSSDEDLHVMSNLIDAFAGCMFCVFSNQKEKMNMRAMKKMISSVKIQCGDSINKKSMADAIFENIKDQNSMPCKYYNQFKSTAGENEEAIAEKVLSFFDKFSDFDLKMMESTDWNFIKSFGGNLKTALVLNSTSQETENSAKLLLTLLTQCLQRSNRKSKVMFIIDNLSSANNLISLPQWLSEATDNNMSYLIISDNLAKFKECKSNELYFNNIKKAVGSVVLVHHNDTAIKFNDRLPVSQEEVSEFVSRKIKATVLIKSLNVKENDELF